MDCKSLGISTRVSISFLSINGFLQFSLLIDQLTISQASLIKRGMIACHSSFSRQEEDVICLLHLFHLMCNNNSNRILDHQVNEVVNQAFIVLIDAGRHLVKDIKGAFCQNRTGTDNLLALTRRQESTVVTNNRIQTVWQILDKLQDPMLICPSQDVLLRPVTSHA